MKDDLSPKTTWKYDIFFKCSEKMVFPKKLHCITWKDSNFFTQKYYIFFFGWKIKNDFSQEIHEYMIFFIYMYKCDKYDIILLP